MNEFKKWEREFYGRKLVVEHGKMAKQSHGACFVRFGDSAILATVDANEEPIEGADFLPLTVEYQEKFYAAGKIPGGFIKREGRPSENAVLSARLIDRPIRPLFPDGMTNEVQVIVTVLSADPDTPPDTMGIFASSLALNISPIPFNGVVAGVRVGYIDNEYVIFPTVEQLEKSMLDIVVAGTKEAVTMVEGEAKEVSEEVMLGALKAAHDAIKKLVKFQEEILSEFEIQKWEIRIPEPPEGLLESFSELLDDDEIFRLMLTPGKKAKDKALKEYRNEKIEKFKELYANKWSEEELTENEKFLKSFFDERLKSIMRHSIIEKNLRLDGRKHNEIRPITCELDILPRTHGSALFTRGETQSLGTVTLGAPIDEQVVDTLFEEGSKTFMLHYNFPPFSTGEVKRLRGPGRREIGHGHLAERALKFVIPPEEEFPYTIRVVSEILESNGSSSMATVCSGSLALMAAGVPIKKHVAGVAMGLIQEEDKTVVLTDILGNEDHMGDMDFKVTGTRDGITAFQMDVKVAGVSEEIMLSALLQAKEARQKILDLMYATIPEPRKEVSRYAPVIKVFNIPYDKIGELIGPGGRVIKKLSSDYDAKIFIDDEKAQVKIIGNDPDKIERLLKVIGAMLKEIEKGQVFEGIISRVEPYGIFVELAPGKVGLLHSSKLGENLNEFLKTNSVGSPVKVEVTAIDDLGRIQLKRFGVEVKEDDRPRKPSKYVQRSNQKKRYHKD
ncbi:polyribonucleotide nucleotidyltransferase [Kosmotoga pacifica]|uniref:Polyribonucleotide nucleotidyltransferase n=1 Tax=Kosmotoga pacifica TaxID=1330330 RepID=A0A0G2ZDJ4_9BACT|nr:polyribonucleotide nucleotidyltransferase [Kosmotoga pacifica]AKI96893.1 polynucleotide phosphorylase [Kosmotoga pacifica]